MVKTEQVMKHIFNVLLTSAVALMAVSCYKDGTDYIEYETRVVLSPGVEDFNADGTTASGSECFAAVVNVVSQDKSLTWTPEISGADWAKVETADIPSSYDEADGTLHDVIEKGIQITVAPNSSYRRWFDLQIKLSDNTSKTFKFCQLGALADAKVESAVTSLIFQSKGGSQNVIYSTNMGKAYKYEVSYGGDSKDWISFKDNGEGNVDVIAAKWDDKEKGRTATVKIIAGTPATSEFTLEIPVIQNANYDFFYIYGDAVDGKPVAQAVEMERKDQNTYFGSAYVCNSSDKKNHILVNKNSRELTYPCYALAKNGSVVELASAATAVPDGPDIDVDGLKKITITWNNMAWTMERISTDNCLPDSEVQYYPTKDYPTSNGGTKTWMTVCLHWDGGSTIGTMKLGSVVALSSDPNNGGFGNSQPSDRTSPKDFDVEESGGKVKGLTEVSEKYGRIYTWDEVLMGTPQAGMNLSADKTAWPKPYREGCTFIDAVGNEYTMPAGVTELSGNEAQVEAAVPTVAMQIQGICPYGWHVSNLQDWKDLFYAALKACGKEGSFNGYTTLTAGNADVAATLKGSEGWSAGAATRNEFADAFGFNIYPLGRRLYKTGYANYGVNSEIWVNHPGAKGNLDWETEDQVYKVWRLAATTYNGTTKLNGTFDTGNATAPIRCVKNYK